MRALVRCVARQPGLCACHRPRHARERVAMAADALRRGSEGRVRGRAAAALSVENGKAGGERLVGERFEDLRDIDLTTAQSREIAAHGAVDDTGEALRIETEIAKVLLQAKPRRRHLTHGAEAELGQGPQIEPALWRHADEVEGIAAYDLTEAQKGNNFLRHGLAAKNRLRVAPKPTPPGRDGAVSCAACAAGSRRSGTDDQDRRLEARQ